MRRTFGQVQSFLWISIKCSEQGYFHICTFFFFIKQTKSDHSIHELQQKFTIQVIWCFSHFVCSRLPIKEQYMETMNDFLQCISIAFHCPQIYQKVAPLNNPRWPQVNKVDGHIQFFHPTSWGGHYSSPLLSCARASRLTSMLIPLTERTLLSPLLLPRLKVCMFKSRGKVTETKGNKRVDCDPASLTIVPIASFPVPSSNNLGTRY